MKESKKIGIVGLGKMGSTIARMLSKAGYDVSGYDLSEIKLPQKIAVKSTFSELLKDEQPLILAVKPAQINAVASIITDNRLIISIAAGVGIEQLNEFRNVKGPTIRAMPNTPLISGHGVTVLCAAEDCTETAKEEALELFKTGGEAFFIENENWMHAITAISGSGPAFIELILQTIEDAGVYLGLPRDTARKLVLETTAGTTHMIKKSQKAPQDHIHDVTSPAGTTIAGLKTLKDYSVERGIWRAIVQAAERSRQLGS